MVLPAMVSTWLPTAIRLGSVQLIIHPTDGGVDFLMDSTFRQMDWNNMTTTSSKDEKMKVWILVGGNNLRNGQIKAE